MFRDKVELKDIEKMDAEYRDLLGRVVTIQADCEIGGPHLYVKDILPSAPSQVDQLVVARTAAEEMDHFRKMARVAGDIGVDVSFVLSWPNHQRYVFWGLKRRANAQARQEFMQEVNPLIEKMGLKIPDPLEGRKYL